MHKKIKYKYVYGIYYEFYKNYDNSPRKHKKRKYSSIIENLKAENNDLRELLIKKQKNYKKVKGSDSKADVIGLGEHTPGFLAQSFTDRLVG